MGYTKSNKLIKKTTVFFCILNNLTEYINNSSNFSFIKEFINKNRQEKRALFEQDDDGDTLSNAYEIILGTNPESADSDSDNLPDSLHPQPLYRSDP